MKMNKKYLSLVCFAALMLFGVLLSAVLPLADARLVGIAPANDTTYEVMVGYDPEKQLPITETHTATTVKVTDLLKAKRITSYNYYPNEYTEISSNAISNEHNGEALASRGTLRYVITNIEGINPFDEKWDESLAPYADYIDVDEKLHLTMYLPPMLSACNVFVRVQHEASMGTLTGFDSVLYATTDQALAYDETVVHVDGTAGVYLDVPLIVSRRVWNENPIQNGCVITIHYEAEEGKQVGFIGTPIIGPDKDVRAIVDGSYTFRLVAGFLALITFFIFVFVCVLKRATAFVPQLVFAVAAMTGLYASMALSGTTDFPYVWLAVRSAAVGICLLGAALTLPKMFVKIPVKYIAVALALIYTGLAFSAQLADVAVAAGLILAYRIIGAMVSLVVLVFSVREILRGKRFDLCINNALSVVLAVYAMFFFREDINMLYSPLIWLSLMMLGAILVIGFREFIMSESRNRQLTANLEAEVKLQTKNMQMMIDERERILQFISHDMKKPLSSVRAHLTALRQKEREEEPLKIIDIVEAKVSYLNDNLSAVADYARRRYVAENPVNVSVDEIVGAVYAELAPDAEANGIIMEISTKPTVAFAKPDALRSVLQNLVMNAIEHADCSRIWLEAYRKFDKCIITVADDGKGLGDKDVFRPYYSDNDSDENMGLGLYICKSHIEAMNGTLDYEYEEHKLTFKVTLPTAYGRFD